MTRPLLLVTAIFYVLLGLAIAYAPVTSLALTRSTFEQFAHSLYTREVLGAALLLAGAMTLLSTLWYEQRRLRILASGLRAGSMSGLFLLVLLVWLFLPDGSLTATIIFGYLTTLSLMTLPPPVEPIQQALNAIETIRHDQQQQEQEQRQDHQA